MEFEKKSTGQDLASFYQKQTVKFANWQSQQKMPTGKGFPPEIRQAILEKLGQGKNWRYRLNCARQDFLVVLRKISEI